jgi:L-fuconolactonase
MLHLIDSHVHFWQPSVQRYPWLDDLTTLNRAFLPADAPLSGDGWAVDGQVFVQADCLPEQGEAEARWVSALAGQYPHVQAIVAFAPLELGDAARPHLERLQSIPLVRGVRRLLQGEPDGFSLMPGFVRGVNLLADYGLTFDLCIYARQLPEAAQLVRRCPNVAFVLDHFGKPNLDAPLLDQWRADFGALAALPNVVCKLSGLFTQTGAGWKPSLFTPCFEHALNAFGPDRLLFGSDFPVLTLNGDYESWVGVVQAAIAGCSLDEQRAIAHANAQRVYRL